MTELLSHFGSKRVHAIILTRERTDLLKRCVTTALSTLGPDDLLTVVDDSCTAASQENAGALVAAAHCSSTPLIYLRTEAVQDGVGRALGGRTLWQSKTAARDIAPVRNLSLLVSRVVRARMTVIDRR